MIFKNDYPAQTNPKHEIYDSIVCLTELKGIIKIRFRKI